MLSHELLRDAAMSDQPWSRLDEIVRAEMAAGRKVKEIADEYKGLLNSVRDIPDLSEDGDDAVMDTLDALIGLCHPKCRYVDPPNTSLPNEEEIAALPRWGRVAFAVRCAKRVMPLFQLDGDQLNFDKDLNRSYYNLGRVGSAVEHSATDSSASSLLSHLSIPMYGGSAPPLSGQVGNSMYFSASAVRHPDSDLGYSNAAMNAAVVAGSHRSTDLTSFIRRDFDRIARFAEARKWTNDTPVPQDLFGPLWPEGLPKGWPADPELPNRADLTLELAVREGLPDTAIEDEVVNLFNMLNRYAIARGGQPLSLEDFQQFVPAMELAEV